MKLNKHKLGLTLMLFVIFILVESIAKQLSIRHEIWYFIMNTLFAWGMMFYNFEDKDEHKRN